MTTLLQKPKYKTYELPLMECSTYNPKYPPRFPLFLQKKLNGIAGRYYCGQLVTKHGKVWDPEVIKPYLEDLLLFEQHYRDVNKYNGELMIQGEFYHWSLSLQDIVSLVSVNRTSPPSSWRELKFMVFDVVQLDNLGLSFMQRNDRVYNTHHLIPGNVKILAPVYCPHEFALREEEKRIAQKPNHEGFIYRQGLCLYRNGRSQDLQKVKLWQEIEVKVTAWKAGKLGKYFNSLGSLVCEIAEGNTFATSGFTDKERLEFYDMAQSGTLLGTKITVKYTNLSEQGIPLNPQFVCVRNYE